MAKDPVKIDFSKFDAKLTRIVGDTDNIIQDAMKNTAAQAVNIIKRRTREKGQDKDGKAFKPYSESYLKQRKQAGAGSKVNLTSAGKSVGGKGKKGALKGNAQGGAMINSITVERVEDNGHRYVITAARGIELDKLKGHVRGSGSLPKRNPMGFTAKETKLLEDRAKRQIQFKMKKLGNR